MARQYGGEVRIVGLAGRDDVGPMREFVARHDLGELTHVVDTDGELWERFDVPYQPAWVFLTPGGEVHSRHAGAYTPEQLAAALDDLLAAS